MRELAALDGKKVLITGAGGMLGRAFREALESAGCRVAALARAELDVTDREAVLARASWGPELVVHCAADTDANRCEERPESTEAVLVGGTVNAAGLARRSGAAFLYPQSFLIFGANAEPVAEDGVPGPLSVYGRCKLEAERRLRELVPDALVLRLGGLFGGDDADKNFVGSFARHLRVMLREGKDSIAIGDRVWQPTYTRDLAANAAVLLARGSTGVYNMAAHGEATFFDVASLCVERLGLAGRIEVLPTTAAAVSADEKARRPQRVILANARLQAEGLDRQRPWRDGLREYLDRPYFRTLYGQHAS